MRNSRQSELNQLFSCGAGKGLTCPREDGTARRAELRDAPAAWWTAVPTRAAGGGVWATLLDKDTWSEGKLGEVDESTLTGLSVTC